MAESRSEVEGAGALHDLTPQSPSQWVYRYVSSSPDPELRILEVAVQVLTDEALSSQERWNILDYLNARLGRPIPRAAESGRRSHE